MHRWFVQALFVIAFGIVIGRLAWANTPTTWAANDGTYCTHATRSNNNFTVTSSAAGSCITTTNIATSGNRRVYFETEFTTIGSANSSSGISNYSGSHSLNCQGGGAIQINGAASGDSCFGALQNVWVQFALDFGTLKGWVRNPNRMCATCWNNLAAGMGDPTVGVETGGITLTADTYYIFCYMDVANDVCIVNPGNNGAFNSTVPTGYTPWDSAVNPPGGGLLLQGCCVMRDTPRRAA